MKLKKSSASTVNKKAMEKMDEAREELANQISPGRSKAQTIGMVLGAVVALAAIAYAIITFGSSSSSSSSEEEW